MAGVPEAAARADDPVGLPGIPWSGGARDVDTPRAVALAHRARRLSKLGYYTRHRERNPRSCDVCKERRQVRRPAKWIWREPGRPPRYLCLDHKDHPWG